MAFYLGLAHKALEAERHGVAIAYLKRALSWANRERNRRAAGKIMKAIRLCHEAKKGN